MIGTPVIPFLRPKLTVDQSEAGISDLRLGGISGVRFAR